MEGSVCRVEPYIAFYDCRSRHQPRPNDVPQLKEQSHLVGKEGCGEEEGRQSVEAEGLGGFHWNEGEKRL